MVTHVATLPDVSINGVTGSIVDPHDLWRSKMLLNGLSQIPCSWKKWEFGSFAGIVLSLGKNPLI
jgi:hypothetical protein